MKNVHTILQKIPKTAVIPLPESDDGSIMWLNLSRIKYACYNGKEDQLRVHSLLGWLVGEKVGTSRTGWTRMENEYKKSIVSRFGAGISQFTRTQAKLLLTIHNEVQFIEMELERYLKCPEFEPYQKIFDSFGFGLRTRARLLSRIYPFESFLLPDGKFWIERTQRLTTPTKRRGDRRRRNHDSNPTTPKTTKKNKSRNSFKLRLGMGTVLKASGDDEKIIPGGNSICRQALWLYVLTKVETGNLPDTPQAQKLIEYRNYLKSQTDGSGKPLIKGKLIQMKLMSKTTNMLFAEFARAFRVV